MSYENIRIRVAAIIIEDSNILLIAHKKDDNIYWLLPGGGVKEGEALKEALSRELKEELGISVKVNEVALISDSIAPDLGKHILNICFFCDYKSGDYKLGNEKRLYSYKFFTVNELDEIRIIPPIKEEIVQLMQGIGKKIYLGKRWIDQ
ncbi:MAG: NUDIX hydrolase [Spirochaetes bacterium]|nr:NUDIX hydrolase [Spirochaetota bacterium]